MNAERILVASECVGDGHWLLKKGVDYANERRVFGRLIGQNQAVQFPLARAYAELETADMMCRLDDLALAYVAQHVFGLPRSY
jgi:acyl-CoA dehydrogenase